MSDKIEIQSTRLLIREIESLDAQTILDYRSDTVANKYQGWIPEKIEEVDDFIENKIAKDFNQIGTWFQLAIIVKMSNELIGDIGLHFLENEMVEIGCTIDKTHQRKGYATESLRLTINFLFTQSNKQKIKASVDPRNSASIAMIEELGFKKEAHYKKSFLLRGEWVDDVIYGLTRKPQVPI